MPIAERAAAVVLTVAEPVLLVDVATNKDPLMVPTVAKALPVPAFGCVADATEEVTADSTPAVKAETAITAMRLRSVVFDILFLSLVRIRNFLILARRSFDPLIPLRRGTHV
jgi:hypothetical protein